MPRRREPQTTAIIKVKVRPSARGGRVKTVRLPRQGRLPDHVRGRNQAVQVATVLRLMFCPVLLVIRFYAWAFGVLWRAVQPGAEAVDTT